MNRRNTVRFKVKLRFIELYGHLFEKLPLSYPLQTQKIARESVEGKEIIRLARAKIGYSPNYVDIDLLRSLMYFYKEKKHLIKNEQHNRKN